MNKGQRVKTIPLNTKGSQRIMEAGTDEWVLQRTWTNDKGSPVTFPAGQGRVKEVQNGQTVAVIRPDLDGDTTTEKANERTVVLGTDATMKLVEV